MALNAKLPKRVSLRMYPKAARRLVLSRNCLYGKLVDWTYGWRKFGFGSPVGRTEFTSIAIFVIVRLIPMSDLVSSEPRLPATSRNRLSPKRCVSDSVKSLLSTPKILPCGKLEASRDGTV